MTVPSQYSHWMLWALGVVCAVLGLNWLGGQARAHGELSRYGNPETAASLAAILNADGTLRAGRDGSFDVRGYRMIYTKGGAPRFVSAGAALDEGWDGQFALPDGTAGELRALAVLGSDVYVGGSFAVAGNVAANNLAKYNTTTNVWSAVGSGTGNGVNGAVQALAVQGSVLYVGGFFTQTNVGGAPVFVQRVAKFDTSNNSWGALNSSAGDGVNGGVYTLAVAGGDLYVGGSFTQADVGVAPISANAVAKFNTTNNTWSALGNGAGNGVDGTIAVLALLDGELYAGGAFTMANVGGTTVEANNVAKFSLTSRVWSTLGAGGGNGVDSGVTALLASGSAVYVGGYFTNANVGGATVSANRVAKFNKTNNSWSALGDATGNGVNSGVFALLMVGDELYVGGLFTQANVGGAPINARYIVKFNTTRGAWSALGGGVNSHVLALAVSGTDLYVGGLFTQAQGAGAPLSASRAARFSTTSNTWSALGQGAGRAVNGQVRAVAVSGNNVYVGGSFTIAGNVAAHNVAKFDATNNTWSVLGQGAGNGVNGEVAALMVLGNALYVGGVFDEANVGGASVRVNRVAKFDTATNAWSALGAGNGVDGDVYALAARGSDLYVGGSFTQANPEGTSVVVNHIAKFDTTTGAWSGLGNGVDNNVYALAVSASDVYAGGDFLQARFGNQVVGANRVVRWNAATNAWSALGVDAANGVDGAVYALAVNGNALYVGGAFAQAQSGAATISAQNVARFDLMTNTWSVLGGAAGNGVNGSVLSLAVTGGNVYLGGQFTQADSGGTMVSANNVAQFNQTTNAWSALLDANGGNGAQGQVAALRASGNYLYVGGSFNLVGDNKPSLHLGRFRINTAPLITGATISQAQSSAVSTQQIATISDAEDAENTLTVTATPLTGAGVTIASISTDAAGKVMASVGASCTATTSSFTLTVTDSHGVAQTAPLTVNVIINGQGTVTTQASGNARAGTSYSQQLTASGGVNPHTFSANAASLPNGVTLSSTGLLAGTPTVFGSFSFTVQIADANGCVSNQNFTLTIAPPCPGITLGPLPDGTVGAAYNQAVTVMSGASPYSFTITAGALPTGLSLNTSTGQVSGVPTTANSYNFTIKMTDANGCTGTRSYSLTIIKPIVRAKKGDLSGDGRTDVAVWRPSNGVWYVINSSDGTVRTQQWGLGFAPYNDQAVPGDYDGDGKVDYAVWRPLDGTWYIINSGDNTVRTQQWGLNGDVPVPGDYDGDGKTDTAVWRPSNGVWYIINSNDGTVRVQQWGLNDDVPVANDYDGDGRTDMAVWRPASGVWYVVKSTDGAWLAQQWGLAGDVPVPGQYDGDGRADYAVWRPANGVWYVINSANGQVRTQQWGLNGDVPVPGDYDNDNRTDMAVWRNGAWYIIRSADGTLLLPSWGITGDTALPAAGVR